MNLFRYPMSVWWEDAGIAAAGGFCTSWLMGSTGLGLVVSAVWYMGLVFKWAGHFADAEPKKAEYEIKMQYSYPAHCVFAGTLSAGCGIFCVLWLLTRLIPVSWPHLAQYVWLRPWILGAVSLVMLVWKVNDFRENTKRIRYL